jgi:hypothetical protein
VERARATATSIAAYASRGGDVTKPRQGESGHHRPALVRGPAGADQRIAWNGAARTSLVRKYTVRPSPNRADRTPIAVGPTSGAVVVASKFSTSVTNKVEALTPGDTVKLSWTFGGWPGVTDVMGGSQLLVDHGANVAGLHRRGRLHLELQPPHVGGHLEGCSDTDTATCRMFLITIDGRQATNWSKVFACLPRPRADQRGAWMALNSMAADRRPCG